MVFNVIFLHSEPKRFSFQKQRRENVLSETSKLKKKKVVPAQGQMNRLKDSLAARQIFFSPSPPLIERMRCKTVGITQQSFLSLNVRYMFHTGSNGCK